MSSISASFSQVPTKAGFYRVVDSSATVYPQSANASVQSVTTSFSTGTSTTLGTGVLLRDMGKTVTVVNSNGQATEKYALVQRVLGGENTEGASQGNFHVKIWDDASSGVNVARLG